MLSVNIKNSEPMKLLYEYIFNAANKYKLKTALIFQNTKISYYELLKQTIIQSDQIILEGLHKNDRVIILLDNPIEQFIAALSVIRAGGSIIILENKIPPDKLSKIITETFPYIIISKKDILDNYENIQQYFRHKIFLWDNEYSCQTVNNDTYENIVELEQKNIEKIKILTDAQPTDSVYINYVNISKKLAVFNHNSILQNAIIANLISDINPDFNELIYYPLSDIHGFIRTIQNFLFGRTSILYQKEESYLELNAIILKNNCKSLFIEIESLEDIFKSIKALISETMKNLEIVHLCSDEPLQKKHALLENISSIIKDKILLSYSLTEAPLNTIINFKNNKNRHNGYGFPLPGISIKIVPFEYSSNKSIGRIKIKGRNIFQGYISSWSKEIKIEEIVNGFITEDYGYFDKSTGLNIIGKRDNFIVTTQDIIPIYSLYNNFYQTMEEINCDFYIMNKPEYGKPDSDTIVLFYSPRNENIEPDDVYKKILSLSNPDCLKKLRVIKIKEIPKTGDQATKKELEKYINNSIIL